MLSSDLCPLENFLWFIYVFVWAARPIIDLLNEQKSTEMLMHSASQGKI